MLTNFLLILSIFDVLMSNGQFTVIHLLDKEHGTPLNGELSCKLYNKPFQCNWVSNNTIDEVNKHFNYPIKNKMVLYNMHSLWELTHKLIPIPNLNSAISMVESQESIKNYHHQYKKAIPQFTGYSSPSFNATVFRVYDEVFMNDISLLPLKPFASLLSGAVFVSSHFLKKIPNSGRDSIVQRFRENKFRVDGIGNCLRSIGPGGSALTFTSNWDIDRKNKINEISKYKFYFAFENQIESGYVTEKLFDGLIAGIIPIYLGDNIFAKKLLPHPNSVIFYSDYSNMNELLNYLNYLMSNETAYELHREWRRDFNVTKRIETNEYLSTPWYCRICQWGYEKSLKKNSIG